jgi:pyruvate dehydrogenase phosphatase
VTAVDHDILSKPLTLLEAQGIDDSQDSTAPQNSPAMVHLASLETAGACGLTITVDTASDKMYIANIGDCKAVAGWYDPKSGIWRCDVLNRELTVYDENIAEE